MDSTNETDTTIIIERKLRMELALIEEDYPGQFAEYRQIKTREALTAFIWNLCAEMTDSVAEAEALEFDVAMNLLEVFQTRQRARALSAMLRRTHPEGFGQSAPTKTDTSLSG